jgi:hypothetical protein
MRNVLATLLGLALAGGLVAHGAGLAGAQGLLPGPVLGAVEGGVAPAIALAGQGLVVPPSVEEVDEMCALLLGCPDVPLSPPKMDHGECVQAVWAALSSPEAVKFSIPLRQCGMQANSCKQLRECALRGATPEICKGRGKDRAVGFCDNDGRAVTCYHERLVQVRDCPHYDEQCAARDGQATCILGPCPTEVPSDGTAVCSTNGQKIFSCDRGKLVSLDCTAFGLACVKDSDGKPGCAPGTTPTCSKNLSKCDGDDHVGCVGSHEVKVQCGKVGMKCSPTVGAKGNIGACTAPTLDGGTCSGSGSKCNGASVEYCIAGKQRSFFCKGLGFSKCAGKPGAAHCVQ